MKSLTFILMLGVWAGNAVPAWSENDHAPASPQPISALVQTAPVRWMDFNHPVVGYGVVSAMPEKVVNLNLPSAGQVDRIEVVAGQHVAQGDPLLKVSPDPAGRLAYEQAENGLRFAQGELQRVETMLQRQMATRSQLEAARKGLNDAERALTAQKALGNGTGNTVLHAPFAGVVVSVAVTRGDRFAAGANLMQVAASTRQQVVLGVVPQQSAPLKSGQTVRLTPVYDPTQTLEGTVDSVGRQVDPASRLVQVTVRLDRGELLNGATLRGEIMTAPHSGQAVPRSAVLEDERSRYLFQTQDGHAHRVEVQTGDAVGDWIEVRTPLPDAPVVTLGNYELADGMAVRVAP